MTSNPLFQREVRARWRGQRAFWILGGYAALLCLWAFFNCARALRDGETIAERGHSLFVALTILQTLAWMILGPALTATSIASERERGLLDALHLTTLSPRTIALGKWSGALLFSVFLGLISLPLTVLCFTLGSISVEDALQAFFLQGATLACSAAIGLCCSAWSLRAATALRISFGVTLFWGFAGFVAMIALLWPRWNPILRMVMLLIVQINPVMVAVSMDNPTLASSLSGALAQLTTPLVRLTGPILVSPAIFCVVIELIATAVLLAASTIALRRPLDEAVWWEPKPRPPRAASRKAQRNWERQIAALPQWIARLTAFSNPILRHETRGKLRMRQPPRAAIVVELLMALAVLGVYASLFFAAWFQPTGSFLSLWLGRNSGFELSLRETIWRVLPWVAFLVMVPGAALMGATGLARERESGGWEALKLSMLTPGEILWGKFGGVLWACAFFSLPLWPLLLPGIRSFDYQPFLSDVTDTRNGVPLTYAAAALALLVSTTIGAAGLGLLISYPCQRSEVAGGQALGALLLLLGVPPLLAPRLGELLPFPWHPGLVLWEISQDYQTQPMLGRVAPVVCCWLILGVICYLLAWRRLKNEMRRT